MTNAQGVWGFVCDDVLKVTAVYADAEPELLGATLVTWFAAQELDEARTLVRSLRLVSDLDLVMADDVLALSDYFERDGMVGSLDNWHNLLAGTRGSPDLTLQAGYMLDGSDKAKDSLFCDWGYILDLDNGTTEVYQGYRVEEPKGHWANAVEAPNEFGYWPISLVATFDYTQPPIRDTLRSIGEDA